MQAFGNYEHIVEGLAQALSDISDIVRECVQECELFRTKDMQLAIANLYANIFMFLRRAMMWYLKKRRYGILAAVQQDFYSDFESQLANIRKVAEGIHRLANLGLYAESRVTRLVIEKALAAGDPSIGLGGQMRIDAEAAIELKEREFQIARESWVKEKLNLEEEIRRANIISEFKKELIESAQKWILDTHLMNLPRGKRLVKQVVVQSKY